MIERPLTHQQEAFCRAVVEGGNHADAYRRAYPRSIKWKPAHLWTAASELMAMPKVSRRVAHLQQLAVAQSGLKKVEILEEIRRLAHSDIAGIMHPDGRVKLPNELDAATRAAVASFKIDEYGRVEYKFWDKNAALEKAAKHLGLYEVDNKQKADGLDRLLEAMGGNVLGVTKNLPEDEPL